VVKVRGSVRARVAVGVGYGVGVRARVRVEAGVGVVVRVRVRVTAAKLEEEWTRSPRGNHASRFGWYMAMLAR
jgi:hypothetical protein